ALGKLIPVNGTSDPPRPGHGATTARSERSTLRCRDMCLRWSIQPESIRTIHEPSAKLRGNGQPACPSATRLSEILHGPAHTAKLLDFRRQRDGGVHKFELRKPGLQFSDGGRGREVQ